MSYSFLPKKIWWKSIVFARPEGWIFLRYHYIVNCSFLFSFRKMCYNYKRFLPTLLLKMFTWLSINWWHSNDLLICSIIGFSVSSRLEFLEGIFLCSFLVCIQSGLFWIFKLLFLVLVQILLSFIWKYMCSQRYRRFSYFILRWLLKNLNFLWEKRITFYCQLMSKRLQYMENSWKFEMLNS